MLLNPVCAEDKDFSNQCQSTIKQSELQNSSQVFVETSNTSDFVQVLNIPAPVNEMQGVNDVTAVSNGPVVVKEAANVESEGQTEAVNLSDNEFLCDFSLQDILSSAEFLNDIEKLKDAASASNQDQFIH